jgi:hypothetical protein
MKNFIAVLLVFVAFRAEAFISPVGLSIYPPIGFPRSKDDIVGARVNLIKGIHRSVFGLDIGLLNHTETMGGIAIGMTNASFKTAIGLQLGILNQTNNLYGIQAGAFNGMAMLIGGPKNTVAGFQVGLINAADNVYGFQVGLINYAKDLHGIQIGLLNINKEGPFKALPIINVGI